MGERVASAWHIGGHAGAKLCRGIEQADGIAVIVLQDVTQTLNGATRHFTAVI
jgi:hypothetical protein